MLRDKIDRELAKMGCPYRVGDDRVAAWHEGYRAGLNFAKKLTSPEGAVPPAAPRG